MPPRRALLVLILVSAALRLAWAAGIGLGHDEAYHSLFAAHPALSYFDHPPMLAVVESLGIALTGSSSPLALRVGFIGLFAGSTWLMARLAGRFFGDRAGLFAAIGLNVSAYHTAAAGSFALPDGPLLCFWLLTLDRMAAALDRPEQLGRWAGVGLAWGLALLSKYHAVFLPVGLLVYLAWTPTARSILRRPGPYLATAIGLALFSPVLVWNASHEWASFAFQGGRAVSGMALRPASLLGSVAGQAAYLFPWVWLGLVVAMIGPARRLLKREATDAERFLLSQAVTPLLLFSAVASVKEVFPHWTLIAYVSAFPLLGRLWAGRDPSRMRRRVALLAAVPALLAALMVAQYRFGVVRLDDFERGRADAGKVDPTAQLFGWDQVADELRRRGLLDRPETFLFTGSWYNSGHLGQATRESGVPVACYHHYDARSFAFWSRPEDWIGRDGIFVSVGGRASEVDAFARWFERIESLGEFPIVRGGRPLRTVRLYRCVRQVAPFPFEYDGPSRAGRRMDRGTLVAGGREGG